MRTVDYLSRIAYQILDIVFPARCVVCRTFSKSTHPIYLCEKCLKKIPLRRSYECIGCKAPISYGSTCLFCRSQWSLDRLCIAAPYDYPAVKIIIHAFKYRFISELAYSLGMLIQRYIRDRARHGLALFDSNPLIIPVPLHPIRHRWRGFNQAELIANFVATNYQQIMQSNLLVRTKLGPQQAQTEDKEERFKNIKGIFAINHPEIVKGRDIILVDDVCTTGATLNECARVFQDAGARTVTALVIARG